MAVKKAKKSAAVVFQRDSRVETRIIEATVKCFERFGINKTSMEDIAKVAKVSRPTIYRYFPTRHHLALQVMLREVRDHTRLVLPVLSEHRYPPKALVEGIVFSVSTAKEHPYTSVVVSDAGNELIARVAGADQATFEAMSEMWLPSLSRWREDGHLRSGIKLDDLLLWITVYMHTSLGRGFVAMPADRMRRILNTLVVPAVFDMERLKKDFPKGSNT